jgi:hypothetical protein
MKNPPPLSGGRDISVDFFLERNDPRHQPFVPHLVNLAELQIDHSPIPVPPGVVEAKKNNPPP